MNDIERAMSEISDIRSQLAASTRFRGYAPEAVATVGLVSLVVLLAQIAWPARFASDNVQVALVWGVVLLAAAATIAVEAIARTRSQHSTMTGAMLRGALFTTIPITLLCLAPAVAVFVFAPKMAWLLPGIWQMAVGVAAFSSHASMPKGIVWPASMYLGLGAVVTLLSASEATVTPLMAGAPFIIGHLWIALILYKQGASSR